MDYLGLSILYIHNKIYYILVYVWSWVVRWLDGVMICKYTIGQRVYMYVLNLLLTLFWTLQPDKNMGLD